MPEIPSEAEQDTALRSGAINCLLAIKNASTNISSDGDVYCPITWDGLLCWPPTPANTTTYLPCPEFILGSDVKSVASKLCMDDGTWFYHEEHKSLWTNYTKCFPTQLATVHHNFSQDHENLTDTILAEYFPVVKSIAQIGYGISFISLIVAFMVLAGIKRLRCPRNTLHMHLFVSFIFRAAIMIIKDQLFVQGVGLPTDITETNGSKWFVNEFQGNNWECKLVTTLWQYFIMSNYSWILMEGLYLHNLIFMALFSDTSSITIYVILGWGLPLILVTPWIVMRLTLDNTYCWTVNNNKKLPLVIRVATASLVLINFFLFVNIIRVLLLKLKASVCKETHTYRRWAKSTLVLVPLFGVHYTLFLGISLVNNHAVEITWLFCDQVFASFQGFFVAVLYCFINGEVLSELEKTWHRLRCPSIRRDFPLASLKTRPRNSSYSHTSCLSVGVPKCPPRYSKTTSGRRLCSQYTDHTQLSCCSNLTEPGNNSDNFNYPGVFEMKYVKPQ